MEYELIFDDNCEVEIDRVNKQVRLIQFDKKDTIFKNNVKDFKKLEKKLKILKFADTAIVNRTQKSFAC